MTFWKWSQTPASNATADSTINWAEGQAPSSVNDSARAMMTAAAKYRDDTSGAITATGTASAYVVTSNQVFDTLAHLRLNEIVFVCPATNAAGVTLNVDGLGAQAINGTDGVAIPAGTLIVGGVYRVTAYTNEFILHDFYGNPYNIPLGAGIEYWGTTVPNSSFVFPTGQAISRSTYSTLFALFSTTYGVGDGSTTFNLPDKTGRVSAMKEAAATRLTVADSGVDGATLGSAAGNQIKSLATANLPPYTPAGTITNGAITSTPGAANITGSTIAGVASGALTGVVNASTLTISSSQAASTFAGTAQGGTSAAFTVVQPTIVCNYILRII